MIFSVFCIYFKILQKIKPPHGKVVFILSFYDVNHNEGQHEKYPIELPSRNSKKEISPIVDVTEHEVYPLEFANCHRTKPHFDTNGDITEIVTTETEAETEERTTHEQHK